MIEERSAEARVVLEARVLTIQEQTGITATVEVRRGTVKRHFGCR
jgi:hypothetical protein